jgi:cytoskeletal protein CcmA (bactofilin family)
MEEHGSGWQRMKLDSHGAEPGAELGQPGGSATFIDQGADFEGTLRLREDFRIDGEFRGAIVGASTVIVGEAAGIEADVRGRDVIIAGAVVGNVVASRQLIIRAKGRVHGDIETPCLEVEKGAVLNGRTTMVRPEVAARASAHAAREPALAQPGRFPGASP